jgi:two-component system chemotaxis response regulator CheB
MLFTSAARAFGEDVVAVVLSGMGVDGLNGAREVAERGGTVLAQSRESSSVWGMPGAVVSAGLASVEGDPSHLGGVLRHLLSGS